MNESCAVVGIFSHETDISQTTFFSLFSLQHRGQESSGIAVSDGHSIRKHTGSGLVSQIFTEDELNQLKGHISIGHNQYSTSGSNSPFNAQPITVSSGSSTLALAINGNVINSAPLRNELSKLGYDFHTSSDSEVIGNLILSSPGGSMEERVRYAMRRIDGAYSMTIMSGDKLMGVRDPMGTRPLCLGTINGGWIIASESCAMDQVGALFVGEIDPGEIVVIDDTGKNSLKQKIKRMALCIFEYVYFARPDSIIAGKLVYKTRESMGVMLAQEHPVDADLVIGVPDSATAAAIGYSQSSGIPYCEGLLKNRYVGRTFIQPDQRLRDLGVQMKFNPLTRIISGKRLVVVDDSIVRGTTTPRVVDLLRENGASEIHLRICAPPLRHPCFLGVDIASKWELIAAQKSIPQIREHLGVDSLGYLSLDGLIRATELPKDVFCLACLNGEYPIPTQMALNKLGFEE